MRRIAALLILLILLPASHAGGPNGRTPQDFAHPVTTVDIAGDGSLVAVGLADEGGILSDDADQEVWIMTRVQESTYNDLQGGHADDEDCGPPFQATDSCTNSVDAIAVDGDGSNAIIAATGSDGDTTIVFAHSSRGEDDRIVLPGSVVSVAMSDDGQSAIVALNTESGGQVRYYDVDASPDERWSHDTDEAITAIAFSADGERAIAAAGSDIVVFDRDDSVDPFVDSLSTGSATAVAIGDHAEHYAIAGTSTGAFRLYSDTSVASKAIEANIRGSPAITAVAIHDDARVAVARDDARVQIISLESSVAGINVDAIEATTTLASAARHLTFSGDGGHLLVRSAKDIGHYTPGLERLWSTQIQDGEDAADIDAAAISDDGARIAVAAAGKLHLFEAFYDLDVDIEHPGAVDPGDDVAVDVVLRNAGNRVEDVALDVTGPSGWNASLDATSARVLPDGSETLRLTFQLPGHAAPGGHDLQLQVTSAQGATSHPLAVEVGTVVAWALEAGNHATSLSVESGGTVDFKLTARNEGNIAGRPPVEAEALSNGWTADVIQPGKDLDAGEERDVVVRLQAPQNAKTLDVGAARVRIDGGDWIELQATVGASFKVGLDAATDIDGTAGAPATLTVTVRNDGNAADAYRLTAVGLPAGWSAQWNGLGAEVVTRELAPGESTEMALEIAVPGGVAAQNFAFSVRAQSLADDDVQKTRNILLHIDGAAAEDLPDEPKDKKQPGFPLLAAVLVLGAFAWTRRR